MSQVAESNLLVERSAQAVFKIAIESRSFEIALYESAAGQRCHWILTSPGELALSGEGRTEGAAFSDACSAASALTRLRATWLRTQT